MTSLLIPPDASPRTRRTPRHLLLVAAGGAAAAVAAPLAMCAAVAVIGWFLADAGAHGAPRDALGVGALGWLTAHGSGVRIHGVALTAWPLLVTLGVAVAIWRSARRVGEEVSGHGPDADRIADGERDWTVPGATAVFAATYATLLLIVGRLAGAASGELVRAAVVGLLLCSVLGGVGIAIGSGRAAVWVPLTPTWLRDAVVAAVAVLRWLLAAALLLFLVALLADLTAAANVLSQLDTGAVDTVVVALLSLVLLPNAVVCSAAYLLGSGFTVGTGTVVTPTAVVLGPLPLFPLLAALPGDGPVPPWTPALLALPPVLAGAAAYRALRWRPVSGADRAVLRGLMAGLLVAVALAGLAAVAGGAVGPGRMQDVGPDALGTLVRALPALGIGAVAGSLLAMVRFRRDLPTGPAGPGDPARRSG